MRYSGRFAKYGRELLYPDELEREIKISKVTKLNEGSN